VNIFALLIGFGVEAKGVGLASRALAERQPT